MTDKARELLERTAEILELLFEGPNDVDPNTLAMLGDTRLDEIRAYLAEPEVKPFVRLSEEEIFQLLFQVDPLTKKLPPGFKMFARAIEDALEEKNK